MMFTQLSLTLTKNFTVNTQKMLVSPFPKTLVLQDESFGKNYLSFLAFTRNYERTSGIIVPCFLDDWMSDSQSVSQSVSLIFLHLSTIYFKHFGGISPNYTEMILGWSLSKLFKDDHFHSIWVKVFRIIPEFSILRLTFHRKSASKC